MTIIQKNWLRRQRTFYSVWYRESLRNPKTHRVKSRTNVWHCIWFRDVFKLNSSVTVLLLEFFLFCLVSVLLFINTFKSVMIFLFYCDGYSCDDRLFGTVFIWLQCSCLRLRSNGCKHINHVNKTTLWHRLYMLLRASTPEYNRKKLHKSPTRNVRLFNCSYLKRIFLLGNSAVTRRPRTF